MLNFKNLGRYVMDELPPASYNKSQWSKVIKAYIRAADPLSNPPTFKNKMPKWYDKYFNTFGDIDYRMQNYAIWIGIPESEISQTLIYRRSDGSFGFKQTLRSSKGLMPDPININDKGYVIDMDSQFGIGGLHSKYTLKGTSEIGNLWLYEDKQVINPQWILVDKLKNWLGISDKTKIGKIINWFGKKDLKIFLGFKNNIEYKQYLFEDKHGNVVAIPTEEVPEWLK